MLRSGAIVSGFRGFVSRGIPRDNPPRVKGGYLLSLRRVTLSPCKQGITDLKIFGTKRFIPKRFELGATLSWPIWFPEYLIYVKLVALYSLKLTFSVQPISA